MTNQTTNSLTSEPAEPNDEFGLTTTEREEYDRYVTDIKAAHRESFAAVVRLGTLLLALVAFRSRTPRHERARAWARVCDEDLGVEVSSAYDYMDAARVDTALRDAGLDPVSSIAQAVAVAADGGRGDAGLMIERVRTGRALAESESVRAAARHFEDARARSAAPDEAGLRDALAELDALDAGEGVADQDGLRVVTADGGRRRVLPWEDGASADWPDGVDRAGVTPIRLDPVADLAWPILVRDPRAVSDEWALPDGPFQATYVPGRLGSTTIRSKATASRSRVVLAAPDVDALDDAVPNRVVREIAAAVAADPARLYLLATRNVARAAAAGLPPNAVAVVVAHTANEALALAEEVRGAVTDRRGPSWAIVLRDLACAPPGGFADPLGVFDWVLVRGAATTWEALAAVYQAVPDDRVHVEKGVRARPEASPLLARLPAPPERPDRPAVPVKVTRRPGGPALPAR